MAVCAASIEGQCARFICEESLYRRKAGAEQRRLDRVERVDHFAVAILHLDPQLQPKAF